MRRLPGDGVRARALVFAAISMLVSGCSDTSGSGKPDLPNTGVSASEVCDGTLDSSAAAALRRLSGADRFDELTGTNEAGEPNVFSTRRAVEHLHDEYLKQSACWVYSSAEKSGQPLLEIRFSASSNHPSNAEKQSRNDGVVYPLGVYALAGPHGANLFFRCPTKPVGDAAAIGRTDFVKVEMTAPAHGRSGGGADKDHMVVLNSMARAVAKAAGCSSLAALPKQVPEVRDS